MKGRLNVAVGVFVGALLIAITLVVILLRNPATHWNLEDPTRYDRTELAYLDQQYTYEGYGTGDRSESIGNTDIAGRVLYVRLGCIGCHGAYAEGATVARALWELEEQDFARDVRDGPSGMPAYPVETLSDDNLDLLFRFVNEVPAEAATLNVTTSTAPPPTTAAPPAVTTTTHVEDTDEEPTRETTTVAPEAPAPPATELVLDAPVAAITVDGDPSDWEGIAGLELTLQPIVGEEVPARDAGLKVAHDDSFIYVLFSVEDDFNWSTIDPHFSGAPAVMWPVEPAAGPHMGGEDPSGEPALGMVDIWYWRLDCPIGQPSGGAVSGPGSGDPGNDDACNLDDEWATEPDVHDDDVGPDAENSLLGAFTHTNPVEDADGTWYFEMSRPLTTGDPQDAQFAVGETTRLALAYWDPDAGQNGWGRRDHVQSSDLGWIDVLLAG